MFRFFLTVTFAFVFLGATAGCSSTADQEKKLIVGLTEHLTKFKIYPVASQLAGIEGTNKLRFTIDGDGNVVSYELVQSSGSADLDAATLELFRRAQPLPKPPAGLMKDGPITITAPLIYSLDGNI
ncbi:energy transducer TonB [Pseudomonas sp. BCA14]|uniref:energy transducer TonB family protein n=1 Tax=unclassified Pseudomonas TaxID=196821 RepID=UPI00106DF263|nr:energy transducer TonB [Pseudomonas sp. JMN1]TFF15617.1 energy transducer TonB [Pseudomonas sp. BCA17]TFF32024.1 energy transducer TonB [Pseudomonas sp. BCA14]TFF32977.1 energy transducer TonB [Pseudomonas sp. BCA13]